MANVAISGDTSGAVTLTVPSTVGTQTATFPAATGTVMVSGNMPVFKATANANQTISSNVATKLQFNTSTYDTNSCYNTSTYRFTPNVAGYYTIILRADASGTSGRNYLFASQIYKNGSLFSQSDDDLILGQGGQFANTCTSVIYCNGSTDYIEAYYFMYDYTTTGTVSVLISNSVRCEFSGYLVRTA
jgi:hypothetical protein